jgi:hypothetical protein
VAIKVNKIRCKHCGDVIESKYRHDFKKCSCGLVGVDGGTAYLRRCFRHSPEKDFEELSESWDDEIIKWLELKSEAWMEEEKSIGNPPWHEKEYVSTTVQNLVSRRIRELLDEEKADDATPEGETGDAGSGKAAV